MIKLLHAIKVVINSSILYVLILLIMVYAIGNKIARLTTTTIDINQHRKLIPPQNTVKTDCRFQPKKCPPFVGCDCLQLCDDNPDAALITMTEEVSRVFNNIPNVGDQYCYVPTENVCRDSFATWHVIKETQFKCMPKYWGVFSISGQQLAGQYPHSQKTN